MPFTPDRKQKRVLANEEDAHISGGKDFLVQGVEEGIFFRGEAVTMQGAAEDMVPRHTRKMEQKLTEAAPLADGGISTAVLSEEDALLLAVVLSI